MPANGRRVKHRSIYLYAGGMTVGQYVHSQLTSPDAGEHLRFLVTFFPGKDTNAH